MAINDGGMMDRNQPQGERSSLTDYAERSAIRARKAAKRAALIATVWLRATPGFGASTGSLSPQG